MIFGKWNLEKIWHENLTDCPPRLSDIATLYLVKSKKSFSIIHSYFWLFTLSHEKTICNPLTYPIRKCHHINLWIAKLFHLTEGLLRSLRCWRIWKEQVVGGSENNRLWCVATGMSGKKCHSKCSDWPRSALISGAVRYPRHLDTYTVDTDVTIPVSPRSRYIAVYRRTNNYRETTQLHASIVSITDAVQRFRL